MWAEMRYWFLMPLFAMISACEGSQSTKSYLSPDGQAEAFVKQIDRGACCSTSYEVEIRTGATKETVFSGNGAGGLIASWKGNNELILTADDMYQYELTARLLRKQPFHADGSENSIRIIYAAKRNLH